MPLPKDLYKGRRVYLTQPTRPERLNALSGLQRTLEPITCATRTGI